MSASRSTFSTSRLIYDAAGRWRDECLLEDGSLVSGGGDGEGVETGDTAIARILPTSRFARGAGRNHDETSRAVIARVTEYFDRYFGLG